MHELSIANSIIEIVEQHVSPDEQPAVREVKIRVGELAGVIPDSLEFCYSVITASTPLHHSHLVIETVPLTMKCKICGKLFESGRGIVQCPMCEGFETEMISGTELHVVEIEMAELLETS